MTMMTSCWRHVGGRVSRLRVKFWRPVGARTICVCPGRQHFFHESLLECFQNVLLLGQECPAAAASGQARMPGGSTHLKET